jgi:shikimate 5-dehydrogenase
MIKIALMGDSAVQHYTVADRLWELISVVVNKKFKFTILPITTLDEALAAFETFRKDQSFIGFNISGVPWERELVDRLDKMEKLVDLPSINTVYRDRIGSIVGTNTAPLAAQLSLEFKNNLYKCKTVLIIGASGAGVPLARHFYDNLDKKTYVYDPLANCKSDEKGITCLSSLNSVTEYKYDLIINASPLGRYYFDRHVEAFTSPLDLESLQRVTHKDTIVQETNYLPGTTLLLQMARHLGLRVVMGDVMLVFEAVESLRRYFGITLDENTIRMLVDEIGVYIAERETAILERA